MSFMGKLHIASWGLLLGAMGQAGLYMNLLPQRPTWAIMAPLALPWLTVYTISFCKVAPFGPRPFRNCLLFAMCWYAVLTIIAEILLFIFHPCPARSLPSLVARILTYVAALSFIVLIRSYVSCCVLTPFDTNSAKKMCGPLRSPGRRVRVSLGSGNHSRQQIPNGPYRTCRCYCAQARYQ